MTRKEVIYLKDLAASLNANIQKIPTPLEENVEQVLHHYSGERITRSKTRVKFGCGAVNVSKRDLITVAEYIEMEKKIKSLTRNYPKALARLVAEWKKHNRNVEKQHVLRIPPTVLKQIAGNVSL